SHVHGRVPPPEGSSERSVKRFANHHVQGRVPPEGSSEHSAADPLTEYHANTEVPSEVSSERSAERSADQNRPRAVQGLDGEEARYLRRAASRVRTLWAKAD
ncbi:unnamed protein product, partial [Laminaria digitata]